jgi:hypothetical protein
VNALQYLAAARARLERVQKDYAGEVSVSDLRDLREDELCGYVGERDYSGLQRAAAALAEKARPGESEWMLGHIYQAIALHRQSPPANTEASALLEAVVALGFSGKKEHDRLVLLATRWRAYLAATEQDVRRVVALFKVVAGSPCAKELKQPFLEEYRLYGPGGGQ